MNFSVCQKNCHSECSVAKRRILKKLQKNKFTNLRFKMKLPRFFITKKILQ